MRGFDFSKLGGWPLTQDKLDWMQSGYQDPIRAIAEMGGTVPHIISGIVQSGSTVSDGWLYYNGEVVPFTGGAVGTTIAITTYKTMLVYGDGNSFDTQYRKAATFGTGPVQFNYADLKTFQEGFGQRSRSGWLPFVNGTGSYYLNKLTGIVTIRGTFVHSQYEWTGGLPEMKSAGTIPAEIAPTGVVWFRTAIETHHQPFIFDGNGQVYTGEVGRVNGTEISISSRKLQSGTPNPTHNFYFSYQL